MTNTALPAGLPTPEAARDGVDAPFWDGLRDHRLLIPQCRSCGEHWFPPDWVCPHCRARTFDWHEVPATGRVFTWTRVWHPTHPALAEACPYVVVVVALDADPSIRMIGNLVGDPTAPLAIDGRVEGVFEDGQEATLLQWRRR